MKKGNKMTKQIVIFDADGTLTNLEHRRGYVRGPRRERNWAAFNAGIKDDAPIPQTIAVFQAMAATGLYHMIVFTARNDSDKSVTEKWFSDNNVPYDSLYMRRSTNEFGESENGIRDSIVKNRMIKDLGVDYPDVEIFMAFDDRPSVIKEVWNNAGIFCFDVGNGCDEF